MILDGASFSGNAEEIIFFQIHQSLKSVLFHSNHFCLESRLVNLWINSSDNLVVTVSQASTATSNKLRTLKIIELIAIRFVMRSLSSTC
jgi:hypothetical protein